MTCKDRKICLRRRKHSNMEDYNWKFQIARASTENDLKCTIFWDITPCSLLKIDRRFGGGLCLPPDFTLVSCSVYSSTLKMEATWSSEASVGFQRTSRHYIPEDRTLHNHRCENLKSYISSSVLPFMFSFLFQFRIYSWSCESYSHLVGFLRQGIGPSHSIYCTGRCKIYEDIIHSQMRFELMITVVERSMTESGNEAWIDVCLYLRAESLNHWRLWMVKLWLERFGEKKKKRKMRP
jgi:hypothetical protein